MAEEKINECCRDCFHYKKHKDKCWFYWENKRECTQKLEEGEDSGFENPIEDKLNQ